MENNNNNRDSVLSKFYKLFLGTKLNKKRPYNGRAINRWFKANKEGKKSFKTLDGNVFYVANNISKLVASYYDKVIMKAIENPGKTELLYIGTVEILQINSINGKPRIVPDNQGGFKEVVDDHFFHHTKYKYEFKINRNKIKAGLRKYITSSSYGTKARKYLKRAYELYPKGNFYNNK